MTGAWRKDQQADRYFRQAKAEGYRTRSAYKLLAIQEKFKLLHPVDVVVDLGAAPGGWSQVASGIVGPKGQVVAADLAPIAPLPGVRVLQHDILATDFLDRLRAELPRPPTIILSDLAPSASGILAVDQARARALVDRALEIAREILPPGGNFVAKIFRGEQFDLFQREAQQEFSAVKTFVPPATRRESREAYVVCFRHRPKMPVGK